MQTLYHKSRRNAIAEFLAILWGRGDEGIPSAGTTPAGHSYSVRSRDTRRTLTHCRTQQLRCEWLVHAVITTDYNKKRPFRAFFIITGGDEGIRTLDTVAGILHFQCSALDQLCDVSVSVGQIIQQTNPLCFPSVVGQQVRQPMRFPILHQFHATMDLRLRQPLMILRLLRPQGYLCMTE